MIHDITFLRSVFSIEDLPADGLTEICISGRSNVGKSSLINRLGNRKDLARTSRRPGVTRSLNFFIVGGGYFLVDLPGYGYARVPKSEKNLFHRLVNPYFERRKELGGIIQLIDSRHGPVAGDHGMLEWLRKWNGRVLYVFTKADKLTASQRIELKRLCGEEFGAENSVLFSARTGMGLDSILVWIEETVRMRSCCMICP
jgi:GTP-binding protein